MGENKDVIDAGLENLRRLEDKRADKECSNVWCDRAGTVTYHENQYSDGFPVCRDCLKILNAEPDGD